MNKKVVKSSVLTLALMMVMVFAMSMTALAANTNAPENSTAPTGLYQTGASQTSVEIAWTADMGAYGYYVYTSLDGVTWTKEDNDKYPEAHSATHTIEQLSPGMTFWVKVASISSDYVIMAESAPIQVMTAPGDVNADSIVQTKATTNSMSIQWAPSVGATGYLIFLNDGPNSTGAAPVANVNTTAVTVPAMSGSRNTVYIVPYAIVPATGAAVMDSYSYAYGFITAPGKPVNVASADYDTLSWNPYDSNKVTVGWKRNANDSRYADGYQMVIYNLKGKKLKTYNVKGTGDKTFNIKSVKNTGFKVKVRAYVLLNNEEQYGSWSSTKVVIPPANADVKKVGSNKVKITWDKVKNATKYEIYVCKDASFGSNQKFKKVKTVKKNVTSYTYSKFKKGEYNGVYIVATVKVGKKTYKSEVSHYVKFYYSNY